MGILILLATILFAVAAAAVTILLLIFGKVSLIKYVSVVCLVWFAAYALLLIGVSLSSGEHVLSKGQPKRYCGFYLDCHMATAVSHVKRQKEYKGRTAEGTFVIVGIEVSSNAKRAALGLVAPTFTIIVDESKGYKPIKELSTPMDVFEKRIAPDERINGEIVFDLPESLKTPRLDIRMSDPIGASVELILIGDEDSLFHKRTYFSLEPERNLAGI